MTMGGEQRIPGACPLDCPDTCSWVVTVRDGRPVRLEGDPDHPFTRGVLCNKLNDYVAYTQSPERLLHPMRRVRRILDPLLSSYYALPLFAFYPLFIVLFGVGAVPIVIMGFLAGLAAMVLSTLDGLDSVPRVLSKVARMHQMGALSAALRLQNALDRAAAEERVHAIEKSVAPGGVGAVAYLKTIGDLERDAIELALRTTKWNKEEAARRLGISRASIYMKVKKFNLQKPLP